MIEKEKSFLYSFIPCFSVVCSLANRFFSNMSRIVKVSKSNLPFFFNDRESSSQRFLEDGPVFIESACSLVLSISLEFH